MDIELEKVVDHVNIISTCEHVREIEMSIRVVTERMKSMVDDPTFKSFHKKVIIQMICFAMMC